MLLFCHLLIACEKPSKAITENSVHSDSAPSRKESGRYLQNQGNIVAAIAAYDAEIDANPKDIAALGNRAVLLNKLGRKQEALLDYEQILEIDPGNYPTHEKRAALLADLGKFDQAVQSYDLILQHRKGSAEIFDARGAVFLKNGKFKLAIQDFDSALAIQPNWVQAIANRGTAFYEQGNFQAAKIDFLRCGNQSAVSINGLGLIAQFAEGDTALARRHFIEATITFPFDAAGWYNLAFLNAAKNERFEAIRLFSKALDLDSSYLDAAINRGLIQMQIGETDKALSDFEFVRQKSPENSRAILLAGWAKCEKGDWLKGCLDLSDAQEMGEKEAKKLIERYCK